MFLLLLALATTTAFVGAFNAEGAVADAFSLGRRDCRSFPQDCNGCRGYLDTCCQDINCGKDRDGQSLYCKQGDLKYTCDVRGFSATYTCHRWTNSERSAIKRSSEKAVCEAGGNVYTKGKNSKYPGCGKCWCCAPVESSYDKFYNHLFNTGAQEGETMAMATSSPHHLNLLVNVFAAIGIGFLLYGAGRHFLAKNNGAYTNVV